jgi:hypothetical protein
MVQEEGGRRERLAGLHLAMGGWLRSDAAVVVVLVDGVRVGADRCP